MIPTQNHKEKRWGILEDRKCTSIFVKLEKYFLK